MPEGIQLWWADWSAFVQMGRHGPWVWGSVAATALGLMAEQWGLRRQARRLQQLQAQQQQPTGTRSQR